MAICKGRYRVPYYYSRYGYTRGNGTVWHGGIDIELLDDDTIRFPTYKGNTISGTVRTSRIVTNKNNKTWEWGYYVAVELDANQTPDAVNWIYFCHNTKNLVYVGNRVKSGDPIAIVGNTGNAAQNSPPYKHCHLEVRQTAISSGLDPTNYADCQNVIGVYGSYIPTSDKYVLIPKVDGLRARPYPVADDDNSNGAVFFVTKGHEYECIQTRGGWAYIRLPDEEGGAWVSLGENGIEYCEVKVVK